MGWIVNIINSVDNAVNKGFERAEKAIDRFDKWGQETGGAIDDFYDNAKRASTYGLQYNEIKGMRDSSRVIIKNLEPILDFIIDEKIIAIKIKDTLESIVGKEITKIIEVAYKEGSKMIDVIYSYNGNNYSKSIPVKVVSEKIQDLNKEIEIYTYENNEYIFMLPNGNLVLKPFTQMPSQKMIRACIELNLRDVTKIPNYVELFNEMKCTANSEIY